MALLLTKRFSVTSDRSEKQIVNDISKDRRFSAVLLYSAVMNYGSRDTTMEERTDTIDLPRGGKLSLRPVTPEDDEFLLSVYASTRLEELSQVEWAEGQKETFLRWQYDLQRREYEARFPDASYDVILIDDQPAGRIWKGEDEKQIRLLDIALLSEFQKRGAGTLLLRQLIEHAIEAQKPLRHMVFVLNNDAHRFYERLGFVVIDDLGAYKHMEYHEAGTGGRRQTELENEK